MQKLNQFVEIDAAVIPLLAQLEAEVLPNMSQVQKIAEALGEDLGETKNSSLLMLKCQALVNEDKLYLALKTMYCAYTQDANNHELYLMFYAMLRLTLSRWDFKVNTDLGNLEIGPIFEILYKMGHVGIDHQVMAARHYNQIENYSRAAEILLPIAKIYPNTPLLQDELLRNIEGQKGGVLVAYQKPAPIPKGIRFTKSMLSAEQTKALIIFARKINYETPDSSELLKYLGQINDVLGEGFTFLDTSFLNLYYKKAVILDLLKRPFEAAPIFEALRYLEPANTAFQSSFRVCMSNLSKTVLQIADEKYDSPLIEAGFKLILNSFYPEFKLVKIYCRYLVTKGEDAAAIQIASDLIEVNPHDFDYLMVGFNIGHFSENDEFIENIQARVEKLKVNMPWNLAYVTPSETLPKAS